MTVRLWQMTGDGVVMNCTKIKLAPHSLKGMGTICRALLRMPWITFKTMNLCRHNPIWGVHTTPWAWKPQMRLSNCNIFGGILEPTTFTPSLSLWMTLHQRQVSMQYIPWRGSWNGTTEIIKQRECGTLHRMVWNRVFGLFGFYCAALRLCYSLIQMYNCAIFCNSMMASAKMKTCKSAIRESLVLWKFRSIRYQSSALDTMERSTPLGGLRTPRQMSPHTGCASGFSWLSVMYRHPKIWLSWIDHHCNEGSGWSLVAYSCLLIVWMFCCSLSACRLYSVASLFQCIHNLLIPCDILHSVQW